MRQRVVSGVSLVLGVAVWLGSGVAAWADQVDEYVRAEMARRHVPGLSLAVVREGRVVLAKGYGLADVELEVPAKAETVYELGSITKQFTATAVMMLAEEGKVALDEKIAKYLEGLPAAWGEVTVRHLLNHTSGIKSYTSVPDNQKFFRLERTREEILKPVKQAPVEFKAGEKFAYNNSGYFLLGMIIEKVSGKGYGEFLQERIFGPLSMAETRVNDQREIIKNRSKGYAWQGKLRNGDYASMTWPFAAGALVSTVVDMAKWDAALYGEKVLRRTRLDEMWTATKLADGKTADYGFGWAVAKYQGHREVSHGGGIPGFSTYIARFVDDKLTVIVLCNLEGGAPAAIAHKVAGFYVSELAPAAETEIADKEPKTTEMFRGVLATAAEGKIDPELFTAEMRKELFPEKAKEAGALLKSLGGMKSMALVERAEEGKNRVYRYRVVYEGATLVVRGVLTEEGKIAGITVRGE